MGEQVATCSVCDGTIVWVVPLEAWRHIGEGEASHEDSPEPHEAIEKL